MAQHLHLDAEGEERGQGIVVYCPCSWKICHLLVNRQSGCDRQALVPPRLRKRLRDLERRGWITFVILLGVCWLTVEILPKLYCRQKPSSEGGSLLVSWQEGDGS